MNIQLTSNAANILLALARMPVDLLNAIRRDLDEQNQLTVAHIQVNRLSGKGPFDPSLGKLGVRSNRYRQSVRRSPAVITGNSVHSAIGTNLKPYPELHEFGADFTRKAGSVRLRTDASGALTGRGPNGRLATFAGRRHKRVKVVGFAAHGVKVPARAPLQRGLADKAPDYGRRLSTTIVSTWNAAA